ncbi:MAG: SDR family oxidoreductase [Candidatus Rokubacteria bacterium]|nr:SDR family oxidoreductase [Candidatus Rokubacteria bacterium]
MRAPALVTGTTGFIGREITRRLLRAGRPVLALARGREGEPAAARVAGAVGYPPDGRQLDVVEADFDRAGCGLSRSDWRRLRTTVETVIHCAGDTSFFPEEPERFRRGHIEGPLELLGGLARGRLRRWAQLSTAYVCGTRSGTVFEREGDLGQDFHNPYERVKLESEVRLRAAGRRLGVDVRVFRPSIVVGEAPATSGGRPSSLFFDFLRLVEALTRFAGGSPLPLRIEAAPVAPFNIVPVEYVADAVIALAEHPEGAGETFHLVVSAAPAQAVVLEMITGRFGLRGLSLVDSREGPLPDPSPLERRVARMLSGYREYLAQDVRFDDAAARELLGDCGVEPPLLSRAMVHGLIDRALLTSPPETLAKPLAMSETERP